MINKFEKIIHDLKNTNLKGYEIAKNHDVSPAYVSQIKNKMEKWGLIIKKMVKFISLICYL